MASEWGIEDWLVDTLTQRAKAQEFWLQLLAGRSTAMAVRQENSLSASGEWTLPLQDEGEAMP